MPVAVVYVIQSEYTEDVYVGSILEKDGYSIGHRLKQHRNQLSAYLAGKYHYCGSFEIIKHPDCWIEEIDRIEVPIDDTEKLRCKLEQYWIEQFGEYTANCRCAYESVEQRREKNNAKAKQYHIEHREERAAKAKQRYADAPTESCLCGGKYNSRDRSQHQKTEMHHRWLKASS